MPVSPFESHSLDDWCPQVLCFDIDRETIGGGVGRHGFCVPMLLIGRVG